MRRADFKIGVEFSTADGELLWRCTDVGSRVIIAILINDPAHEGDTSWLNGPPYAVLEHVFDEHGIVTCKEVNT